MRFKLGSTLLIALIALVALIGCENAQDLFMDTMLSMDDEMNDTMDTPSMDTGMADAGTADMEAVSVKLVWLINYPLGGKADYIAWVTSVAPTLQAPEEVERIASYDNISGENPHRLVEFEFGSFMDAMTYLNRPDIAAGFLAELPEHSSEVKYACIYQAAPITRKTENPTRKIKSVYLVDYPLGGKAANIWRGLHLLPRHCKLPKRSNGSHLMTTIMVHRHTDSLSLSLIASKRPMPTQEQRRQYGLLVLNSRIAPVVRQLLTYELRSDYISE